MGSELHTSNFLPLSPNSGLTLKCASVRCSEFCECIHSTKRWQLKKEDKSNFCNLPYTKTSAKNLKKMYLNTVFTSSRRATS